ncbi:hypothetical protein N658DRAFT_501743 [Parathielavia hyrcaniae]|uniref:Uncharacterized protein n=1 Tax=Parathielavia hyrcaniae TaxID=113614 RepID=A0AAN6PRA5_9PEZI|nr:hypothetical protein N658DRAFT_501743 [Parathielavia hyrcaniae]
MYSHPQNDIQIRATSKSCNLFTDPSRPAAVPETSPIPTPKPPSHQDDTPHHNQQTETLEPPAPLLPLGLRYLAIKFPRCSCERLRLFLGKRASLKDAVDVGAGV